ncbi:MAG: polyprenyl diphosphate synthase [bacterium]|nr:polyprenyl diphosphate synthase [bacterium]
MKNDQKSPKTVGIIMDGNRRFAKARGKETNWGHAEGFETFKKFLGWANEAKIENVIAYAFSSENWKRSKMEVSAIMMLFKQALLEVKENIKKAGPVSFIGDATRFPQPLQILMKEVVDETRSKKGAHLYLALSYGGRDEIVRAVNKISRAGKRTISEKDLANELDTKNVPDPDLIIRTGGQMRLSNFLPWQSIYSELFFSKTLWPAFTEKEFKGILLEYGRRKRNFGV